MADWKARNFGFYTCLFVGVGYLGAAASFLMIPASFRPGYDKFLLAYAQDPTWPNMQYLSWIVTGLAALAALPAIARLVRPVHERLVDWVTRIALISFSVLALDNARSIGLDTLLSRAFTTGDETTRKVIGATVGFYQHLDPFDLMVAGGASLWMVVVCVLGLKERRMPRFLGYLGIVAAALYWVVIYGKVTENRLMFSIVSPLAIVCAPLWYIGMGLVVRRQGKDAAEPVAQAA